MLADVVKNKSQNFLVLIIRMVKTYSDPKTLEYFKHGDKDHVALIEGKIVRIALTHASFPKT